MLGHLCLKVVVPLHHMLWKIFTIHTLAISAAIQSSLDALAVVLQTIRALAAADSSFFGNQLVL